MKGTTHSVPESKREKTFWHLDLLAVSDLERKKNFYQYKLD
jgi:hypothetical protein